MANKAPPSSKSRNTPSHQRVSDPSAMRLTERDRSVLLSVYRCRVLTSHQIEVLHFPPKSAKVRSLRSACQRRLQKLFHHQFLDRILQPVILGEGRMAYAYALGPRGADVVASSLDVDRDEVGWKPKDNRLGPLFLDHTIAISDVRVVTQLLVRQHTWQKVSWIAELTLKSEAYQSKMPSYLENGRVVRVFPDAYFTVALPNMEQPAHFFLEIDQGTMTTGRWADKMRGYMEFRSSGASLRYFNTGNFRVLAVAPSEKRLSNLKRATENVSGKTYFWFTTADEIDIWSPKKILEPIWQVAGLEGVQKLFNR